MPFLASLGRDSPWLYVLFVGALAAVFAALTYLAMRIFLPQLRPRVTKRWRSEAVVLRTASLAQSIILFRTVKALPALTLGFGCGMLLTAGIAAAGHGKAESTTIIFSAVISFATGLAAWRANRDVERSNYEPFVKLPSRW